MNGPCSMCGTYHASAVCPQSKYELSPTVDPMSAPATGKMTMTLNGISLGEQQIIDKLDKILELLWQRL